jgi:hypothetical protein
VASICLIRATFFGSGDEGAELEYLTAALIQLA